jgi:hypothetical protein
LLLHGDLGLQQIADNVRRLVLTFDADPMTSS